MAKIVGYVKNVNGKFIVKSKNHGERTLQKGEPIYENDVILPENNNSDAKAVVGLIGMPKDIEIDSSTPIVFDKTVTNEDIAPEDMILSEADVNSGLRDVGLNALSLDRILQEYGDMNDAEFKDGKTDNGNGLIKANNSIADVNSDLRDVASHSYELEHDFDPTDTQDNNTFDTLLNIDLPRPTATVVQDVVQPQPEESSIQPTPVEPNTDNSVFVQLIGNSIVSEGDNLTHTLRLVDRNGNPVTVAEGESITVNLTYTNGANLTDDDYTKVTQVTIPAGSSEVTVTVPTIDDTISEDNESYTLEIASVSQTNGTYENVEVDTVYNSATGTIQQSDPIYVILEGDTTVKEGDSATYTVKFIDENGHDVIVTQDTEVDLKFINNTTSDNDTDKTNNETIAITIPAGSSSATLNIDTIDDYLSDNNENYKLEISEVRNSEFDYLEISSQNSVTTTIVDGSNESDGGIGSDDTVYAQIVGDTTVGEGDSVIYTVKLVDKDGNEVQVSQDTNVKVKFTNGTTSDDDTDRTDNETITLTIPEGSSFASFDVNTIDDYIKDNNENYTLSITNVDTNEFENVDISNTQASVTTNILDGSSESDGGTGAADTVYLRLDTNDNVEEKDNETITHKIHLVDKDGNAVVLPNGESITVNFAYSDDTTSSDDFSTKLTSLTLNGDGVKSTFDVENVVKADSDVEGHEQYTIKIDSISSSSTNFENIAIDTINEAKGGIDELSVFEGSTIDSSSESVNLLDNVEVSSISNKTITEISYTDENGDTKTTTAGTQVDTQYGKLTVNSDGTWEFIADPTENNPNNVDDIFTYTVENSNDSSESATATAGIIVKDTAPTVGSVTTVSVDEDDLNSGSDTDKESLTVESSLAVTKSQDDINVTFNVTDGSDSGYTSGGSTIYYYLSDDKLTLTASTAISKDDVSDINTIFTDVISENTTSNAKHTFTLNGPIDHPNSGEDTLSITLPYKVVDSDGDELTNTYQVNIVDDIPTATNETAQDVVEGENTITGNVLSNDTQGADGANVTGFTYIDEDGNTQNGTLGTEVDTQYGKLTLNSDGSWSYISDPYESQDNNAGDSITDNFTYTLTDSDGDTATATQDINVTDGANPTLDPVDTTAKEADLGTGATLSPTTVNGSIDITKGTDNIADTKLDSTQQALKDLGLKSSGQSISYSISDHEIIATRDDDSKEVFRLTLKDFDSINANYDFKLSLPIDHTQPDHDETWELPISLSVIDSDGDEVSDSFSVTVEDSTPTATNQTVTVDEDNGSTIIRLSQDDFGGDGTIKIDNNDNGTFTDVVKDASIDVLDPGDKTTKIGTLTNNGDGTVTFTPETNYSNYDTNPYVKYSISDNDGDEVGATLNLGVNPIADAPTISVNNISTTEDDNNTKEGTNSVSLGLTLPTLNDQTDINSTQSGDNPERAGLINLSFNDGVDGAKITKDDGTVIFTVGEDNKTSFEVYISDQDIHYSGIDASSAISLTKAEYEALKIIPAEDNAKNIDIDISLTSYEVKDDGTPIDLANIKATTTQTMIVDVQAVTDDISLKFDSDQRIGSISTTDNADDTFTFTTVDEDSTATTIDLTSLLTKVSGTENDTSPDLDGSEIRSYIFSGLPAGSIITLDGVQTKVASDGTATINFPDNTKADPDFKLQIAPNYSGDIDATLTLHVKDSDSDSSGTIDEKTVTLHLKGTVDPVADDVTIQIKQAIGDEDAGRSAGNDENTPDATIDHPENGIPLEIIVTSDDNTDISDGTNTDSKETYTVTIDGVPDGGSLYVYDTSDSSYHLIDKNTVDSGSFDITDNGDGTWKVTIDDYDNNNIPKFIPPQNSNTDYSFDIKAHSTDGSDVSNDQTLTIDIQVKGVADKVENTDLVTLDRDNVDHNDGNDIYSAVVAEDNNGASVTLSSIFEDYTQISSYDSDGSESISIVITGLASEFSLSGDAAFLGGSGESRKWVIAKDDLPNVTLTTPSSYAGEVDFKVGFISTENDGDSLTSTLNDVKVLVTPVAEATINTTTNVAEDTLTHLDLTLNANDSGEELKSVDIKISDVDSKDFTIYLDSGKSNDISTIGDDDGDGYYNLTSSQAQDLYIEYGSNIGNSSDTTFEIKYTTIDTATSLTDGNGDYVDTSSETTTTYTLNLSPVTDDITIDATNITDTNESNITIDTTDTSNEKVTINDYGDFTIDVDISATDTDGSESATRVAVDGVPVGVLVGYTDGNGDFVAGTMSGDTWFVDIPDVVLDATSATTTLTFKVTDDMDSGTGTQYPITITTYNQDGSAEENSATTNVTFVDNIDGNGPDDTLDATLNLKSPTISEDTEFTLNDLVAINYDSKDTSGGDHEGAIYTIAISNLANTSLTATGLSNVTQYNDGTKDIFVVSGTQSEIENAMSNVQLIPNSNYNENNASSSLDIKIDLTAYMPTNSAINSSDSETYTNNSVVPVTDEVTIDTVINSGNETLEDGSYPISISLSTVDNPDYTLVESSSSTTEATMVTINYVSGVYGTLSWSGGSYTFDSSNTSASVPIDQISNLTFTPVADASGDVNLSYEIYTLEDNASNIVTTNGNINFDITPVVDGLSVGNSATGDEDSFIQVVIDGEKDTDGSEVAKSVLIDNIPDGFLVYYGDSGSETLAQNAGDNGSSNTFDLNGESVGYNLWNIPLNSDGSIPNIWIKAPENWSGTVDDVTLTTVMQDGSIIDSASQNFTLTVNPIVDDITISPTQTFGNEGEDIPLNLNANVEDLDGSESVTLTLSGFGDEKAAFKVDGVAIDSSNISYDSGSDTYTITGIDATKINDLSVVHSEISKNISVTAKMVESDGSNSSSVSGSFDINIHSSIPSSDNDTLLYKGENIDGLNGEDTLVLNGESIDFSKVSNIETLDLNAGDNTISNLTVQDVVDITDDDNELVIKGDSADSVTLDSSWSSNGTTEIDGHTFNIYTHSSDPTVTLKIQDDIDHS